MGYFITPVVMDISKPDGGARTITIIPEFIEEENNFTGSYEIVEEDNTHGFIAFDEQHVNWEHTNMLDLSTDEINQIAEFIKTHDDPSLDDVDWAPGA